MADAQPTLDNLWRLDGKVALVTGAGGYLGSAFATALAEAEATVIAASRTQDRAQHFANTLPRPNGVTHYGVAIDQIDEDSINQGFEQALEHAGRIDILVNNGHAATKADWSNVTGAEFTEQLENVTGYFLLARKIRDSAVNLGHPASVIMVGSMYGMVASYPDVYAGIMPASPVAYHACKGGVLHLTRHLAVYWAQDRVRVNCLSPGAFPNPTKIPPELFERLVKRVPMNRVGSPNDLKTAVVFLAGDGASYMTGQNLVIDGGWTAW